MPVGWKRKIWPVFLQSPLLQSYKSKIVFTPSPVLFVLAAEMGTTHFFFNLIQRRLRRFEFLTQLMTHNGSQELIQINSWLEMFFLFCSNRLTTQMLPKSSIQIDSRLKKLSRILFQINSDLKKNPEFSYISTHDSKNFLEYWFESNHDSIILLILVSWIWPWYDLFWACDRYGISTQVSSREIDSNQLITHAVSWIGEL